MSVHHSITTRPAPTSAADERVACPATNPAPEQARPQPIDCWTLLALLAITLLAAALRLWRLDTLPGGLHFDEAAYGLQAQDHILRGETPVFFSNYAGREALFQYTIAPWLLLFGPTILAVRLPAALWSIALVPIVALLGARLWGWRAGLLAALAVACGPWLLHIGRTGYRANTLPLVSSLAVLMLYRALQPGGQRVRDRDWLLSGALFGLSLYTYAVVRVLPLLGPLLLLYLGLWHRERLRRSGRGIALFALALLIVSTPYVYHMLRVPSDWSERFRQVSLTEAEGSRAALLLDNLRLALSMFGVRGVADDVMRLPFRPVFVGVAALPFYVGVGLALWRWRELACGLVLLWLGVMLLPVLLAADTKLHWIHAIGAAPPTYLLWGLGAASAWAWLSRRWTGRALGAASGWLIGLLLAGWWTQATSREYFQSWARRPEVYYNYMQYATDAARAAEQMPATETLLISEDYYRHATYLFLAPRTRSAQWFDARSAVVWPRSAPWTAIVSASTPTTDDIAPLIAEAQGEPYAPDGLYSYIKLRGTTVPPFTPPTPLVARFGEVLELQGIDLRGALEPGATMRLQLYNQALAAPGRELRLFVHIEDERNRVLAQQDVLGYDAREWQPGDQFISFHTLRLPPSLPEGRLRLVVGLYDAVTGQRYQVSGTGAQGDFIELAVP